MNDTQWVHTSLYFSIGTDWETTANYWQDASYPIRHALAIRVEYQRLFPSDCGIQSNDDTLYWLICNLADVMCWFMMHQDRQSDANPPLYTLWRVPMGMHWYCYDTHVCICAYI